MSEQLRTAAQAALEALLAADLAMANGGILACHASRKQIAAAIEALRAALAEPQPLTDEQWYQLWLAIHRDFAGDPYDELKAFARAIEAAHGIGVKS